eukprot:GFYU01008579.1.p1 GENE.GFYU01008579.1~~GFYU01008579.1.p1  ORF type:complete len:153 (-),score=37.70 GFYU01008579.1:146-604(-)
MKSFTLVLSSIAVMLSLAALSVDSLDLTEAKAGHGPAAQARAKGKLPNRHNEEEARRQARAKARMEYDTLKARLNEKLARGRQADRDSVAVAKAKAMAEKEAANLEAALNQDIPIPVLDDLVKGFGGLVNWAVGVAEGGENREAAGSAGAHK